MRRKVTDIEVPADVIQAAIDLADGYGVTIMPDDIEFWVLEGRAADPQFPEQHMNIPWRWEAIMEAKSPPNQRTGRYRTVLTRPPLSNMVRWTPLTPVR